jgi:hypothetical protein
MKISESNEHLRISSRVGKLRHEMQKKSVQDEHSLISL